MTERLPAEGLAIPLRASFIGLKSVPVIALAHNNAAPLLVLFEDRFVQRVIFRKDRKYADVEHVEVTHTDTDNLEIAFRDSRFTFSCKTRTPGDLVKALSVFEQKGIKLGETARRRMAEVPRI